MLGWAFNANDSTGEVGTLFNSLNAASSTAGCTGAVVNTLNAADFKRITSATDSRQIQLGGRIRF